MFHSAFVAGERSAWCQLLWATWWVVACSGEVIRLLENTLCKFSVCFPKEKSLVAILLSFSVEFFSQLQQNWRKERRLQNIGFLQVLRKQIARQKAEIPTEQTVTGAQVLVDNKAQISMPAFWDQPPLQRMGYSPGMWGDATSRP